MGNADTTAALSCGGFPVSLLPRGSCKPGRWLRRSLGRSPCSKSVCRFSVSGGIWSRDVKLHRGIIFVVGICLFSFPVQAQEKSAHSEPFKSHFACAQRDFDIFMGQLSGIALRRVCSVCGLSRLFSAIACLYCVCWSCT